MALSWRTGHYLLAPALVLFVSAWLFSTSQQQTPTVMLVNSDVLSHLFSLFELMQNQSVDISHALSLVNIPSASKELENTVLRIQDENFQAMAMQRLLDEDLPTQQQPALPQHREKYVHPRTATTSLLPQCYADAWSRTAVPLPGFWSLDNSTLPYWDLSCPMEWSKYSCVHQGAKLHARTARRRFTPSNCSFSDFDAQVFQDALGNRSLYLSGDSLIRQVWISLGCLLGPVVAQTKIKWATKSNKWPCHETKKCIQVGPHSGFNSAEFTLQSGSKVLLGLPEKYDGAVVVIEAGVHGNLNAVSKKLAEKITLAHSQRTNSTRLVWMATPPPAFKTRDGEYDATHLAKEKQKHKVLRCASSISDNRLRAENQTLQATGAFEAVDAVLALDGIEDQGHSKIGGGVGTFGDCQHYCMPGIPDQFALALYNILLGLSSEGCPKGAGSLPRGAQMSRQDENTKRSKSWKKKKRV
eukprot:CAMPEP_0181309434 /NCGR_PEP_ID=MMETSP1101-20121128/12009_1 /TAXON_ID=46948 /ORGANISM="Rhodomonas abbreviata, Strain Caron Lab Isolate" /LENGTH=469 /DNA_ID=CAMNT_0023415913 /DNA_START=5 /DNA_END=1411 /DNA_ORIENTATION=+